MAPVLSLDMGRDAFKAFLTDVVGISSDINNRYMMTCLTVTKLPQVGR